MYKPQFNKRHVLVFHQFGNKGWSLFSCLGREVVCSVLSVSTLTYASADSISTHPVVTDSVGVTTAREQVLDEVSVTGSRAPLTRSQAAKMVTVLDRADIQQAPVQSINDLLKYAVGIDVRQRSPMGAQTDISIRGGTQEQIIVLLNGINICDPQTGHNTMDLPVDPSDIQRIEIIEGPAGRIYGTSSLVGAINIITNVAEGGEAKAEAGSYGYARLGFRHSFSSRPSPLSSSISASYARCDGWSRAAAGSLNSDYSGAKGFYQGAYHHEHLHINWNFGVADKGWGSSTAYATPKWRADDQYEHTTKLMAAVYGDVKWGAAVLHPTLYWNQHRDRYEGYRGQPEKMKFNYNRTNVFGASLNSHFDWKMGRTAFGAEVRNEDLISANLGEPLSRPRRISGTDRDYTLGLNRTNFSAFAEHNVLLRELTISAGIVMAKNTWADMNWRVYPGIDASLRLSSLWSLHASYNTSLRMPSFTEMYYRLQGYDANPHLKPEEMQAVEIGASMHSSRFTAHTTLWHHHGRNMIDWILDTRQGTGATWQSVNHTRLNSMGLEATIQLSLSNSHTLSLSYGYSHQEKDLESGLVSQYAMEYLRHKLVAKAALPLAQHLLLYATLRWQDRNGQYTDFDGNACDYKPYWLADTRLVWKKSCYEIFVEANNLLNNRYRDYGLVEQPGRWIIGGIKIAY